MSENDNQKTAGEAITETIKDTAEGAVETVKDAATAEAAVETASETVPETVADEASAVQETTTEAVETATDAVTEAPEKAEAEVIEEKPAEPEEPEEISYHAVENEGEITAIWEMQGQKHLRTIDPRSTEGQKIFSLFTSDIHETDAGATEAAAS